MMFCLWVLATDGLPANWWSHAAVNTDMRGYYLAVVDLFKGEEEISLLGLSLSKALGRVMALIWRLLLQFFLWHRWNGQCDYFPWELKTFIGSVSECVKEGILLIDIRHESSKLCERQNKNGLFSRILSAVALESHFCLCSIKIPPWNMSHFYFYISTRSLLANGLKYKHKS